MLFRLLWPVLRRNRGRTIGIMLQFMIGCMVAALALSLMLQEKDLLRRLQRQWSAAATASFARVAPDQVPPPDMATVRHRRGQWRRQSPEEMRDGSVIDDGAPWMASYALVNAAYIAQIRPALAEGRWLHEADGQQGAPFPVVLNAAAAARMAPNGRAVGRRLGSDGQLLVVGVLAPGEPVLLQANPFFLGSLASREPVILLPQEAEAALRQSDLPDAALRPDLPLSWFGQIEPAGYPGVSIWRMAEAIKRLQSSYRSLWIPLQGVTAILLFLAATGFVGVVLTSLEQRWRELAIRAALGASPVLLVGQILLEVLAVTVPASAAGALLGAFGARYLPGGPPGMIPVVPFWVVASAVLMSGLVATLPAHAALRMPIDALMRAE